MAKREIIQIDEEKCDGCGLCVTGCAEGALAVIDGKARLVGENYCDGLGACLKQCPNDALQVIVREAPDFDEKAVETHLRRQTRHGQPEPTPPALACGCPGSMVQELKPMARAAAGMNIPSALRNWPVQLHLVPTKAPFYNNAGLLIAADCTGFTLTGLHRDFLPDRSLIIACPKLDQTESYSAKLTEIFQQNQIPEVTVLYQSVPCCFGLVNLVKQAIKNSGQAIPLRLVRVDMQGQVTENLN
ncbi:MAG: 4Fe-4S binding protein [Deltaproteobacteria bacterium]|nr:4Fe-4S binding protein [Deltaproteobacteria bacterium]